MGTLADNWFWFLVIIGAIALTVPAVWIINLLERPMVRARARRINRRRRKSGKRGIPIR